MTNKKDQENILDLGRLILFIATIIIVLIALGALSFHIAEGWGYFDALYFTVVTFATIGYGDIFPVTIVGKILVMFYAFLGVPLFVALTTLFMERRFRKFVFDHFSHHSKKLAQTEKKLVKQLEEATQEIKDEAKITMKQERKIKKIERELKQEDEKIKSKSSWKFGKKS